jgi:hypothetical protein
MKTASNRILNLKDFPCSGEDPAAVANLRFVAQAFGQLHEDRHFADYNLTKDLDPVEALTQVKSAEEIFTVWRTTTDRPSVSGIPASKTRLR